MQSLNLMYPDKDDFKLWLDEAKQELIREIRKEVIKQPEVIYMTRAEIAKKYRISLVTLHQRTVQGMPSVKIGKRILYNPVDVDKYLNKRK